MNFTNYLRIVYLRYIGRDCENLITAIWGNDTLCRHLVYKLTAECNKYNNMATQKNNLNFNGLCGFVMTLDNERTSHFNAWFINEYNTNPA